MFRTFVVNASPLILLARVQRLDLLTSVASSVLVPEAVLSEVDAGDDRDGTGTAVRGFASLQVVPDLELPRSVRLWDLGVGESQVLARVLETPGSEAILDDRTARRCGESLGIPVLGTVGLVLTCRHLGLIAEARPLLEALRVAGLRLKPSLMEMALAKVGEILS